MDSIKYNLITLAVFLTSGVAEFFAREGGGFTLTALIFYGLFHLINNGMFLIKLSQDQEEERRLRERKS